MGNFNDDKNLATLHALYRRITQLEVQAAKAKQAKPLASKKTFITLGCCIHKVVSTFGSINSLITEHDRHQELEVERCSGDDIHEEEEEPMTSHSQNCAYKQLIRFVPAIWPSSNSTTKICRQLLARYAIGPTTHEWMTQGILKVPSSLGFENYSPRWMCWIRTPAKTGGFTTTGLGCFFA
ncbi:hypothetical protein B0H19DRAFT_1068932 [Mycena capillaripes]|nr:hypothetical protein B0H19DRAFT_1068932 [Mycena capillaripes]